MSYTLKGRLQSRLVAALLPLAVACLLAVVLPAWWPVGLFALMLGVGLALDVLVYDLLDYQPGWVALPLGLLELGIVMALVLWAFDWTPPLYGALGLFAGAWVVAQLLAHAGFPLLSLSYAEDGGELGRVALIAFATTVAALAAVGGIGWAGLPPTVRLAAGVHQGPLVLDRAQTLVGEPGTVVRGGIVVRADHVIVRNVTVEGGENGIDVQHAHSVLLDRVVVRGASMDGIHVRRGRVTIRNCTVETPSGYTQGIDISFSHDWGMSVVEDCVVVGGREGIVTHSATVHVKDNEIRDTTLRGIAMTEMSMGAIDRNKVSDALGVGIFCGDYSHCEIERNHVRGTRPDHASGDFSRLGVAVEAHYEAKAEVHRNDVAGNPVGLAAFVGAEIHEK